MKIRTLTLGCAAIALMALGACKVEIQVRSETWNVSYWVDNGTSCDLVVQVSASVPVALRSIPAGHRVEIAHHDGFSSPGPGLDDDIWAVSVFRSGTEQVAARFAPASEGRWSLERPDETTHRYTLTLADEDLDSSGP
jgi:hypothetical protein